MPAALEGVDWDTGKKALAAGVPMAEVAKSLGVKFRSLQKRAQRGDKGVPWFIPGPAIKRLQKQQEEHRRAIEQAQLAHANAAGLTDQTCLSHVSEDVSRGRNGVETPSLREDPHEKTAALMLQTLDRNDERASLLASNIAVTLLERTTTKAGKLKLAPLEDIQDVKQALSVAKTAAGKGEDDSRVTVNLFAGGSSAQPVEAARMYRRKVVDVQSERVVRD